MIQIIHHQTQKDRTKVNKECAQRLSYDLKAKKNSMWVERWIAIGHSIGEANNGSRLNDQSEDDSVLKGMGWGQW